MNGNDRYDINWHMERGEWSELIDNINKEEKLNKDQIMAVINAIQTTCNHCWNAPKGCHCWNDE